MTRSRHSLLVFLVGLLAGCAHAPTGEPSNDKPRVLILVVDGLRPDYVTPTLMPRLNRLAEEGVRGMAHHAVFPTVTRVNSPSIFTGAYPSGHGQMGNSVYIPEAAERVLDTGDAGDLQLIANSSGGRLLTASTLGEILEDQGLVLFAASSGSTGSGTLMNHTGAGAGMAHYALTIPEALGAVVAREIGPPPDEGAPDGMPYVRWGVDAVLDYGVDVVDADVLALWITEPDGTAHESGIGHPATVAVLAEVDREIGRLMDGLGARGVLHTTTFLVTSDHGFSRRVGTSSLTELLVDAGLKGSADSKDVIIAGDAIHVREGGRERTRDIARLLQVTPWIGPVFSAGSGDDDRGLVPGTASFAAISWDHPRSADLLTSAGWSDAENPWGYRGETYSRGVAGHGTSSPWDIRATFIGWGSGVRSGVVSDVPTGNVDLTPTALSVVGATVPESVQGRVLRELFVGGPESDDLDVRRDSVVVSTEVNGTHYRLTVSHTWAGGRRYFDGTRVERR